ncbi:MAG: hypothetical protein EOP21_05030 [Hyphomicrobiales bacterium]|nr:MAG: hypothetical protein EOP21_05030 [Hyphomicrobiales bacterium]
MSACGPYLPVDPNPWSLASLYEADVGPCCSILALQVTVVWKHRPRCPAKLILGIHSSGGAVGKTMNN